MNKKLTSFVTAFAITSGLSVAPVMTATAAEDPVALRSAIMNAFDEMATEGILTGEDGTVFTKATEGDDTFIQVTVENTDPYDSFDEMLLDSNVTVEGVNRTFTKTTRSATDLDVKVTLDMENVAAAYSDYITLANNFADLDPDDGVDSSMIANTKVNGTFDIEIIIPSGLTFKEDTFVDDAQSLAGFSFSSGSLEVSDIFSEVSRSYENNVLTVQIAVDNKTQDVLDTYFNGADTPDLIFAETLVAPAPTVSEKIYEIKGSMTGTTDILSGSGLKIGEVNYRAIQDEATGETDVIEDDQIIVSDIATIKRSQGGSPGGGTTYYTVNFKSSDGTTVSSQSIAHNAKVTKPADPTYEGYVFDGWYTDEALTIPYDFNAAVTKSITLYAKWTEVAEPTPTPTPAPPSHPVPDDLNGVDHFAYVVGYPEGDVRPNNNITRAEVATIFFRLLKDDVRDTNLTSENSFADVNEGDWFNAPISTLAKLGILTGRTADEFEPNANITRAEFAAIATRFDDSEYGISDSFSDIADHWAENYIHEAADYGWITGYEDGTFRPDQLITRAEAMTIINRVLQRVPENTDDLLDDMVKWTDNADTSKWYYIAVQEATNSHDYTIKDNNFEKWTILTAPRDWTTYEK